MKSALGTAVFLLASMSVSSTLFFAVKIRDGEDHIRALELRTSFVEMELTPPAPPRCERPANYLPTEWADPVDGAKWTVCPAVGLVP